MARKRLEGQATIEYAAVTALMVAIIVVVMTGLLNVVPNMGNQLQGQIDQITNQITAVGH